MKHAYAYSFLLAALGIAGCAQESATDAPMPAEAPAADATVDLTTAEVPGAGIVIANGRIITGTGQTIDSGSIHVEGDRIAAVRAGAIDVPGALVVDASGYTVIPGFIDAHRHVIQGDAETYLAEAAEDRMREFLEAGFTTVLSAGDDQAGILELKRRTETGEIAGPRILTSGRAQLSGPAERRAPTGGDPARFDPARPRWRPTTAAPALSEDEIRARVQEIAAAGHEYVKTGILVTPGGPETEALAIVADESARLGLVSMTHAVAIEDMMAAVEAGTHMLNHTPHIGGFVTLEQAQIVADSGIPMISTVGIFSPFYDEDNNPLFRDAGPTPFEDLSSAGTGPVNGRLLAEAGVTYGFGTDVRYHPEITLESELKTLFLTFSKQDVIEIMTRNTAEAIQKEEVIGTLEPGKLADIVLIDGDPLYNLFDLLEVEVVLKEGRVLVDNR